MTRQCMQCGQSYKARTRSHRFCSNRCSANYRYRDHIKRPDIHWGKRQPLDSEHRRLRAILAPRAIGEPCPLCGHTMQADAIELDHVVARAQGGKSIASNVRIICRTCNRKRGASLGGKVAKQRRSGVTRPAVGGSTAVTPWTSRSW